MSDAEWDAEVELLSFCQDAGMITSWEFWRRAYLLSVECHNSTVDDVNEGRIDATTAQVWLGITRMMMRELRGRMRMMVRWN